MKKLFAIVFAMLATFGAHAQETFDVSTGDFDKGSTYAAMFRELAAVCSNDLALREVKSTGSPENMQRLIDNKVNGAILQGDLLAFTDQQDPAKVANIKTLFTMAPEELHFIARADVKKEGGYGVGGFKIGGTNVEFRSLSDLQGRTVGAVGGSILSGRVIARQSGLNFRMDDAGNNDELQKRLLAGQYDAILVVGGAPHGLVRGLDTRFRLLPVPAEVAAQLKSYTPTKLSYDNLNQSGVPTVQTQALFVTRTYRSPVMLTKLKKLRECYMREVPNIQDRRGSHAKWQQVNPADKGRWAYYELN